MNDAEKLTCIPEEIIFQSYLQRTLDRLRLVYDPQYSSTEIFGGGKIIYLAYGSIWQYIPEFFRNGENILDYAESLFPVSGAVKNLGYLPFLAWFSVGSRKGKMILDFDFPEGGTPVNPENLSVAAARFPTVHGVSYFENITSWIPLTDDYFFYPLDLSGDPVKTYSKYQMAKAFDSILDNRTAIIHTESPFVITGDPDCYKRCDLYCTFDMKIVTEDGLLVNESTSTVFMGTTYGEFGWVLSDNILRIRRSQLSIKIYSKSLLRYKFAVICKTESSKADYGTCKYDFSKSGKVFTAQYSVIYESPDWCEGNSVWEYEFSEGERPADENADYVRIHSPSVIVYPEYPDRLNELYQTQIERN